MLDTTVRGIVYEAAGSVDRALLAAGAELVRERCEDSRIPFALLDADPGDTSSVGDALRSGRSMRVLAQR